MTNDELDELMIKAGLRFGYPFSRSHLVTFSKLVAFKERDALKSKIDRLKYIMESNAYKDEATLSVEICVLDDEAVGDFSERICWFVDRAME